LDHVAALEGQLLGQVGHGDRIADGDLAHDRRGRALEATDATVAAAATGLLATLRLAAAATRAGAGTARAVCGGQVQLAGETAGSLVVVGGHGVRPTGLVLGGAAAVVGGPGGRTRRARGDRPGRGLRLGLAGAGGLLGGLALIFLALALGLFLLALALCLLGALAVDLGQALLLGEIALAGLLQLAQHLGALIVHRA